MSTITEILDTVALYFHNPLTLMESHQTSCFACNNKAEFGCKKCYRFVCAKHCEETDCTRLIRFEPGDYSN